MERTFAGLVVAHPTCESAGLPGPEAPLRQKCEKCGTPLVCAESIRTGRCRVCKPHKGKRPKCGKR